MDKLITIRTRGLSRGKDTISLADYDKYPKIRKMIASNPEWEYSDYLFAWVRNDTPGATAS